MNFSSKLFFLLKALLGVIVFDVVLLLIVYALGSYFNILHSFTWFGFKIIVIPFSVLAFIYTFVYLLKLDKKKIKNKTVSESEKPTNRMEKYHSD